MARKTILLLMICLAVALVRPGPAGRPRAANPGEIEQQVREAEARYASEDYLKSREVFVSLAKSFPDHHRFSYFRFMIAKCDYHLHQYASARTKFADFIHRFPRSKFVPASYLMLGNISYLEGEAFESAQSFIYSYELAGTDNVRLLAKRSLQALLERWLSEEEMKKLSRANRDKKLAPKIWFGLGTRQYENGDLQEAFKTLDYYRNAFPKGEDIEQVALMLENGSSSRDKTINVGVLVPLSGDLSVYGNSLLNGIKLALSSNPSGKKEVQLVVRDTQDDFVKAAQLCRELISNDRVVCIIGPLRSEAVAAAAVEAEHSRVPLITPTASKKGLAALSDFVFQVSPTTQRKGKTLAESAIKDQGLREFVMLVPEAEGSESEAASFQMTVEGLGGSTLAVEEYAPGTEDFSPYLRRIKNTLLGLSSSSTQPEQASFYDEIPVWVDGIFVSADQRDMYDILSRISNLNIFGTIIGTEVCAEKQVLEFARNIDRQMLFVSGGHGPEDAPQRRHFSELYFDYFKKEPDLVSMLGYDCMTLLLSVFGRATSPLRIRDELAATSDFSGVSGGIDFDAAGENAVVPVYKLEDREVRRLR